MRRSVSNLIDYMIRAMDGEFGTVDEFYFDDHKWTVRYLVVNTGEWFSGRRVLIPTVAMAQPVRASRSLPVLLTMDQVCNSSAKDTHKPVSRQHEAALRSYHECSACWIHVPYTGATYGYVAISCVGISVPPKVETASESNRQNGDPHLRSTRRVTGYHIQANDGVIGHVDDFIIDDATWDIRYLVVDTGKWLPGRKVLLATDRTTRVSWEESKIFTLLTRDQVKNSHEYDPSNPISAYLAGDRSSRQVR